MREEELVRSNNEVQCFADLQGLELDELGNQIIYHKGKMAQNIIEIGARLIVAKTKVKHGEWGQWLEDRVEISQRTANNWMKVAKEFSDSHSITDLEGTKVVMLLDVPVDMRDQFIEENDIRNMTTRQMKQAIKDMKHEDVNEEIYDKIHEVSVDDLRDFPKHEKYFPNITGDRWMKFLESIKQNGVLEPILVTIDNLILSGHQRVRACRDLGIEKINVSYYKYNKTKTHDEQNKIAFCIGNCTRGQMDLYSNAMIMMGFEEGVARNPKEIIAEQESKIVITESIKQEAYNILNESKMICELRYSDALDGYDVYDYFQYELAIDFFCLQNYNYLYERYKHPLSDEDVEDIIDTYFEIVTMRRKTELENAKIASKC